MRDDHDGVDPVSVLFLAVAMLLALAVATWFGNWLTSRPLF